jgi:hypothetical protein
MNQDPGRASQSLDTLRSAIRPALPIRNKSILPAIPIGQSISKKKSIQISISQHLAPITAPGKRKDSRIPSLIRRVEFGSRNNPGIEFLKTTESHDLPDSPKTVERHSNPSGYIGINEGSYTDRAPKTLTDSDLI